MDRGYTMTVEEDKDSTNLENDIKDALKKGIEKTYKTA